MIMYLMLTLDKCFIIDWQEKDVAEVKGLMENARIISAALKTWIKKRVSKDELFY